jgi:RNA polymerase sigma-54 factor
MDDFSDLLEMSLTAVRERIEQELQENPVLEPSLPAATEAAPYSEIADIVVERSGAGGYEVKLSELCFADLSISQRYTELCQDPALEARAKEYLSKKLQRARRFLEAVERRRETLQSIADAVFRQQRAFLEHGPGHIAPLDVERVAGEAGIDARTVLRALLGKQVLTRHGVLALERFVWRRPMPSSN